MFLPNKRITLAALIFRGIRDEPHLAVCPGSQTIEVGCIEPVHRCESS